MHRIRVIAMGLALTGCAASGGGGGGEMTWMRTDGKPVDAGFQSAAEQCRAAAGRVGAGAPPKQREETMMEAMQNCMQKRGYVWQCTQPSGALALGGCEGNSPSGKGSGPAPSGPPGRSTT
jgi:hypothetical protein